MPKKIIINKKKGILFWITGLSGSGKTSISKKIKKRITRLYGPTIEISGDDFRKYFKLNKYSQEERLKNLWYYHNFSKLITNQKINLIFNLIGLVNKAREWNRRNIDNYVEIYVKTNLNKISNKRKKNIVGVDIKAEFPKKPHITLENDFEKSITDLSDELIKKIKKLI